MPSKYWNAKEGNDILKNAIQDSTNEKLDSYIKDHNIEFPEPVVEKVGFLKNFFNKTTEKANAFKNN